MSSIVDGADTDVRRCVMMWFNILIVRSADYHKMHCNRYFYRFMRVCLQRIR